MHNKEEVQSEIDRCHAIHQLKVQTGWKYLLEHMQAVQQRVLQELLVETDSTKIMRLQERHHAFQSLVDTVDAMGNIAKHLQQELKNMDDDEKFKSEYGLGNE